MSELEKAPTVGAFTEILARTRIPTAFFDALEGVVVTEVICDGCRTNVGTPRYWDSPQGPAGGHFCDRCEDVLAAARQRLAEAKKVVESVARKLREEQEQLDLLLGNTERLQREFFGIVNGTVPDRHGWLTPVESRKPVEV